MLALQCVGATPFLVSAPSFRQLRDSKPTAAIDVANPFFTVGARGNSRESAPPVESERAAAPIASTTAPWQRVGSALMVALSLSGAVSTALAAERAVPEPPRSGVSQVMVAQTAPGARIGDLRPTDASALLVANPTLAAALDARPTASTLAAVKPSAPDPSVVTPAPPEARPATLPTAVAAPLPMFLSAPPPLSIAKPADLKAHAAAVVKHGHVTAATSHAHAHAPANRKHGQAPVVAKSSTASVAKSTTKAAGKSVGTHPISDVVNRYVKSHGLGDAFLVGHIQRGMRAGALAGTAGMAGATAVALHGAHMATSLGAQAHAVGAAAKAAHSVAGMAQATQMGARATQIGHVAKVAAGVAAPLSIVGGALAVFDGGIGIYQRQKTVDNIHDLQQVARHRMHQLRRQGKVTRAVERDYARVQAQLARAEHHARVHQAFGAAKVVFGGMMIAAPFTGPAAPIVGGVGAVGYVATTVAEVAYEHFVEEPEASPHGRGKQSDSWPF